MVPLPLQLAPRGSAVTSARVCGAPPPLTSIFRSLPSAKKPMDLLSGDQNGNRAPSDPAIDCGVRVSSARIQSRVLPAASDAAKARYLPSGDKAGDSSMLSFSGAGIVKRIAAGVVAKGRN